MDPELCLKEEVAGLEKREALTEKILIIVEELLVFSLIRKVKSLVLLPRKTLNS